MTTKKKKPVIESAMRLHIARQICHGLNYIHKKGIIHCDIKMENILFSDEERGDIKVIDFGTSCENY